MNHSSRRSRLLMLTAICLLQSLSLRAESVGDATVAGKIERIKDLLDAGADVNEREGGVTRLMAATMMMRKDIVEVLLAHKALVDGGGDNGTPLYLASAPEMFKS